MWFAYISTTTIGLGDYFLQPEVMFLGQVFVFSWQFLFGFVLISGFLSKFSELFGGLPGSEFNLKERLRKTNLATASKDEVDDEGNDSVESLNNSELVGILQQEVDKDSKNANGNLAVLMKEQALLEELLEKKKNERQRIQEGGDNSDGP